MVNKGRKTIKAILLAIMAVCLLLIMQTYCQSVRHRAQQEELRKMVREINVGYLAANVGVQTVSESNMETGDDGQNVSEPQMLERYTEMYEINQDLAGWLAIEGMKIDYPVMQCEDDNYYLHHDFYGEDSKYGCLYVKERADFDAGTNFIIYGHNMKDGSMFGDLDLYLKEEFYKEHPAISFGTLYEERTYDIIAVFRSQIYDADDDVFKYYQFYEADTQEEFEDFYGNIKELSLYDTGVEAAFGDTFLTLSTCAYHVQDGRLVVVAKRREGSGTEKIF